MATTTAAVFNDIDVARLYARHRGFVDEEFVDELASHLDPECGLVADVGAGTGSPAAALRRRGFRVLALEPSPAMIAEGRRRHPDLPFVRAQGEDLPLPEASTGSVVLLYVLHHADDPGLVLEEAGRVVRREGRVLVVSGAVDCRRQRLFERYFPTLVPDLPDPDEIWLYAHAAGLRVREARRVSHWVYPNREIDEDYVRMVRTRMFSPLSDLNTDEFEAGLRRLERDIGTPLPPAEATLMVLDRP